MFLRRFLVWLRTKYNKSFLKLLIVSVTVLILSIVGSFVIDSLLPFTDINNLYRLFVLLPLAGSLFIVSYIVGLKLHYIRTSKPDNDWVPYRMRFSPMWRRRIAFIIGAFLFVAIYAIGFNVGYTLVSSIVAAMILGLFAFVRTTNSEELREKMNIPDVRDINYNRRKKELELKNREKENIEKQRKSQKKFDRWGMKDKYFDDETMLN